MTTTNLSATFLALAASALVGVGLLPACGSDDPVELAASHLCACEKLREGLSDVAGCEREAALAIEAAGAACAACVNANAGDQTTLVTCDSLSTACAALCGFGDAPELTGVSEAVDGLCACDALDDPDLDPTACQADYELLLGSKEQACIDCINDALASGVDLETCSVVNNDCVAFCQ